MLFWSKNDNQTEYKTVFMQSLGLDNSPPPTFFPKTDVILITYELNNLWETKLYYTTVYVASEHRPAGTCTSLNTRILLSLICS